VEARDPYSSLGSRKKGGGECSAEPFLGYQPFDWGFYYDVSEGAGVSQVGDSPATGTPLEHHWNTTVTLVCNTTATPL
jgi:hypothetical protein